VTLFVPGTPDSEAAWTEALRGGGLRIEGGVLVGDGPDARVEVEWVANDGEFGAAFSYGTVEPALVESIDAAPGALVLHFPEDLRDGRARIVAMVERLRDAGALAVRLEQSKLGWEISRWIDTFSSGDAWAWHRTAVVFLASGDVIQSCGMHAFSLPDVRVAVDGDPEELQQLATLLSVYQLAEDPAIVSGETFAPDHDTPRRVVERWPDTEYPSGHPCHNPYGVWRLGPPGGTARPRGETIPVFVPALHAVLLAMQPPSGVPLTRQQVESVRDQATCIAMTARDAQRLERSRGYADLNPEFVWEQWQLVRQTAG
jgi:hypothetical protein